MWLPVIVGLINSTRKRIKLHLTEIQKRYKIKRGIFTKMRRNTKPILNILGRGKLPATAGSVLTDRQE